MQGLCSDCAYAQADLRLCWSHIPHCWKSHVVSHLLSTIGFSDVVSVHIFEWQKTCLDQEGTEGSGRAGSRDHTLLKSHKNIGFLSNAGPDPLKNHKATKPDLMLGRHRPASETPFR